MLSVKPLFESNKIKLVTSNINKLNEFKRFGLRNINIEKGRDLPEVDGTDIEVIIYKAKDAGKDRLVEDTSLNVEDSEIGVNIRWMLNNLNQLSGKKSSWIVLLGLNDGKFIKIYKGEIKGEIIKPKNVSKDAFGFDPFFVPTKNNFDKKTLEELEKEGKKDNFSARKAAVENFIKDRYIEKIDINTIPKWTRNYQH